MTAKIRIKDQPDGYTISGDDHQTYVLDESATVGGAGISEQATSFDTLIVDGTIRVGDGKAVDSSGNDFTVVITRTGSIHANIIVTNFTGTGSSLVNHGKMTGGYGSGGLVQATGDDFGLVNFGVMKSKQGFAAWVDGDGSVIHNLAGGVMQGAGGIDLDSRPGEALKLINDGLVAATGTANALEGGSGSDVFINRGKIEGMIDLGDGNDHLDTRGGTLSIGNIVGGDGNDTLLTDDADYILTEEPDNGTDQIKSTVSYTLSDNVENLQLMRKDNTKGTGNALANVIVGNSGSNVLSGGDGNDRLYGGKGDDRLIGGGASDTFIFSTGSGHDVIADFETIDEHIDAQYWTAVRSFDELMSHARNQNGGVMITFGNDSLFLDGVHRADLQERHFII